MVFALALGSALMFGAADFSGGYAGRRDSVTAVVVTSQIAGLVLVAAVVLIGFVPVSSLTWRDLGWGALAGLVGAGGLLALYHGLARSVVSIVSPVAALVGALVPLSVGLVLGERMTMLGWLGVAAVLPAIVMLASEPDGGATEGRAFAFTIGTIAGIGFGLFFVALGRTGAGSGVSPLLAARVASIGFIAGGTVLSGRSVFVHRTNLPLVLLTGVLDMGANILFLLAVQNGSIILVSLITSVYPGPTVLLARVVFGERITRMRMAGLVCAIAGVACMGVA